MLLWPKTGVPENKSGRECCWPYLIGQHPLSPVFGQKRPVAPEYSYFAQLLPVLAILCSFSAGYSNRPTRSKEQLTGKLRRCDVEIDTNSLFLLKQFGYNHFPLPVWGMLRKFRCVQTNNQTGSNHSKREEKSLQSYVDREICFKERRILIGPW